MNICEIYFFGFRLFVSPIVVFLMGFSKCSVLLIRIQRTRTQMFLFSQRNALSYSWDSVHVSHCHVLFLAHKGNWSISQWKTETSSATTPCPSPKRLMTEFIDQTNAANTFYRFDIWVLKKNYYFIFQISLPQNKQNNLWNFDNKCR
jgi:hypothetical protein